MRPYAVQPPPAAPRGYPIQSIQSGRAPGAALGGRAGGAPPAVAAGGQPYPVQQPQPAAATTSIPPGTLPPGTVVHVGDCIVTVERFLSEGGFAHVYLATSTVPLPKGAPNATTRHVLKRMVVPDKRGVAEVGKEVEVMRQLKNHPKIVNMIEASVADLPGGVDGSKGYEIYILMEWCQGGGIIDMMNTRLQNRLTEGEILKIFSDVVEAVAHMHYQKPPLIHRDLKVENILLSPPQTYKLCDFGSTTKPLPRDKVPTTVEGIQKIELEINKTTTLQYRAPELVDVWGRKGYDEKIDIWALGVFLYKLCFYTTPFEEHGPLAILNAQYKFPPYPAYSAQIRALIASMLQERASQRPNIYQVHEAVCKLRGVQVRLENKYAGTAAAASSGRSIPAFATGSSNSASSLAAPPSLPTSPSPGLSSPLANIITSGPSPQPPSSMPDSTSSSQQDLYGAVPGLSGNANQIAPMRRGRPTKATASEDMHLLPERQVRTGMASFSGGGSDGFGSGPGKKDGGGTTGSWEAFGGLGAQEGGDGNTGSNNGAGGGSAANAADGFADAFAPTSPVHATSPRFPEPVRSNSSIQTSVQLPSNIAMFSELSKSSSNEEKKEKGNSVDAGATVEDDEERRRFESTFPDINADFALLAPSSVPPAKTSSSTSPPRAIPPLTRAKSAADLPESLVDVTYPITAKSSSPRMPAQLTGERSKTAEEGEAAGPPLPRRPPSASSSSAASVKSPTTMTSGNNDRPLPNAKPTLVSRGSQTSPHLMASWKPPPASNLGGSASPPDSTATATTSTSANAAKRSSSLRQSSIPDLELYSPLDGESRGQDRQAVVDLLGDDLDEIATPNGVLGNGANSFVPLEAKSTSAPPQELGERVPSTAASSVASKRMSFLAGAGAQPQSTSSTPASGRLLPASPSFGGGGGGEREKFRPLKRTSLGQAGAPPPVTSPKPITPTSPLPPIETAGAPDAASVEARFPDLSLDNHGSRVDAAQVAAPTTKETWDEVVEKDDAADSSSEDGETVQLASRQSATKVSAPSFDDDDAPTPRQSSSSARPRFGANNTASPAVPEISRSGPEDQTSASGSESRQYSYASTSSDGGGGGIDLGPALASIHRFAPQADQSATQSDSMRTSPGPMSPASLHSQTSPPLPPTSKTRSGSINSLVSRYEGRGLTGGPPPLGVKPVGLRKNSGGISLDDAGRSGLDQRDPVQPQKLPQWASTGGGRHSPAPSASSVKSPSFDEREESSTVVAGGLERNASPAPGLPPKPATPTMADRQPFKPTPPPGSPIGARAGAGYVHASRPSFGGGRFPPTSNTSAPSGAPGSPADSAGEQEERFAGVSNMKSRWESMAKARDADVRAARTGPRREHAAI
ncbi:hypothetical protein JCM10908_005426 [Rhodotorula pacifica]|uniref:uncharacterized protein n=1 Tax=Rhodotorula pacifica TaxID=1495444 RepID=UPI00316FD2DF